MMSAVGDAVQVLPLATALKRAFPSCHISWLIQPGPLSLVRGHPAVEEFILFQRDRRGAGKRGLLSGANAVKSAALALGESARQRRGGRFDLLLDLQVYFKAGLLTALAPARIKLGFDRRRTRDLNWLFTTHRIPPHPRGFAHTQDQYLEFLRYLGVDPDPLEYGLTLTGEELFALRSFYDRLSRPACALVTASSTPRKDWDSQDYARVAEGAYETFGVQPILVGGASPREEAVASRIRSASRVPIMDERGGGLRRLLWLLAGSRVVVSPDTGPMHMARALEVPVVGVFGNTNPKRSGPYRMYEDLVVDGYARYSGEDYPLSPERRRGGMARITPTMVLEKIRLALEQYPSPRPAAMTAPLPPHPRGGPTPGSPPEGPQGISRPRK